MKIEKEIKILATLGPSSCQTTEIKKLDKAGVDLFRINLSHTQKEDIEQVIQRIRRATSKPICIDTEGPQVRVGGFSRGKVCLQKKSTVHIFPKDILGNALRFSIYPEIAYEQLLSGDMIDIEFGSASVKVVKQKSDCLEAKVVQGGIVHSRKAAVVQKEISMPILTAKDRFALELALEYQIKYVALSFVRQEKDVQFVRDMIGPDVFLISKIETTSAVDNFSEIAHISDALLIDRGDLGTSEPIEQIPFIQKRLVHEANQIGIPIYIATNLLESMVTKISPTRAEVSDVINALIDGADGLVLAAETAIGLYPVACVKMIHALIKQYQNWQTAEGSSSMRDAPKTQAQGLRQW